MQESDGTTHLSQRQRLAVLLAYVILLLVASALVSGQAFPTESGRRLWLLSGIGLWFFVLISAPWFRPPRDSLVNAFTVALLLGLLDLKGVALFRAELSAFRWVGVALAGVTGIAAVAAIVLRDTDPARRPGLAYVSRAGFRVSDALGQGQVIFTPPALISIVGYYQSAPVQQLWLLSIWVFTVSVRPIELAVRLFAQLREIGAAAQSAQLIGTVSRVDNPNIVRVALETAALWQPGSLAVACLPNSEQVCVLPLFHHVQESHLVGTGLCHGCPDSPIPGAVPGHVYRPAVAGDAGAVLCELSGSDAAAKLIGFVVEETTVGAMRFEVSPDAALQQGTIVFCNQEGQVVYYQILDARTVEESFDRNPRGKHVALAPQLGILDPARGFVKHGWVAPMNCPVFLPGGPVSSPRPQREDDEFEVGTVPGSEIAVRAGLSDLLEFHCAIIGATGTGKTELAFDVVRKALDAGTKVFCVDFTGEYKARLSDRSPQVLGLDQEQANELNDRLFAVETGEYGAPKEKAVLQAFLNNVRVPVANSVDEFLSSEGAALGIFELPEIANTRATLRATELYVSSIMDWARRHRRARRVLIVLEEAHTVIPETVWSGFDASTQWVVGRIAQIALQGRKYGVGLLLISQRTALVSKSVLSQCNTHITFSLVDKTSLDYLGNVYSSEHVQSIPNLRFLEAMAYGKAIRSERPVLIRLRYDPAKKAACDALTLRFEGPGL